MNEDNINFVEIRIQKDNSNSIGDVLVLTKSGKVLGRRLNVDGTIRDVLNGIGIIVDSLIKNTDEDK